MRKHDNVTDEQVRRSKSVDTRRRTNEHLRSQAPPIPTPSRSSHRRRGLSSGDANSTVQYVPHDGRGHVDNAGRLDYVGATSDSDESYSDVSSVENTNVDPFTDTEQLQSQIAKLQQHLVDVKGRLNEAKTELALEQSRHPTLYNDHYFQEQLDDLRSQIRQWTVTYFSTGKGHFTQPAERKFRTVSSDWAAYMEDTGRRPWLIQARIWHILQQRLFDPESSKRHPWIYTGLKEKVAIDKMLAQGVMILPDHSPKLIVSASRFSSHVNRRTYCGWRASTFALLFPGKGRDIEPAPYMQDEITDRVRQIMKEAWRPLWAYAQGDISRTEKKDARASLREIASAAVYLDLDLKKHTTEMWFASQNCFVGSEFDSRDMEDVIERTGQRYVRLIVSPPLYKEVFLDNTMVKKQLRKAQVCSSAVQRLPRTSLENMISAIYTPEIDRSRLEHNVDQARMDSSRNQTYGRRLSKDSTRSDTRRRP